MHPPCYILMYVSLINVAPSYDVLTMFDTHWKKYYNMGAAKNENTEENVGIATVCEILGVRWTVRKK